MKLYRTRVNNINLQTYLEPATTSPFGRQATHQMDWAGRSIVDVFSPFSQNFTFLFSSELAKASMPAALHLATLEHGVKHKKTI